MTRRKSRIKTYFFLSVFILACYGGYDIYRKIWHRNDIQSNISRVERMAKSVKNSW